MSPYLSFTKKEKNMSKMLEKIAEALIILGENISGANYMIGRD